ncbi:MAG: hemerythrin domain-containing protein [candidate division KSB1 bacterium]|nr:hemerythrin domain-containing protein [candidate division KSB1 bacterium]MDZ7274252.1 hemerythrin domain-containing protein [candidate division KSB1 bacterium]MDZ7287226.1 hemerythrin domain-containing protein [candidate division KSB1 bacterium]MDZ7296850.1 hemerythrin domain-containing protein [candidate division KSB1 bacterium]MDZ7306046.1 hemerythrin domain-containing protein [candidate division KSB1 bacterium]
MKITDALLGEHAVFYVQFDYLEKNIPPAKDLALVKSQGTMLAVALETHAHLEDELLFVALEAHLDPKSGPLAVMRLEHEAIAQSLQLMQGTQEIAEARNLLLHTIQTARAHFAKEEQIIFRMAQNMLEAETLALLGAQWAARRSVLI